MTEAQTIGVIGVGHLTSNMLPAMALGPHTIILSRRSADRSRQLAATYGWQIMDDNQAIADKCDILVLAVRPEDAADTLQDITLRQGQTVISVCAGIGLDALSPVAAPASVVLSMPVVAARFGASPTAIHPDSPAARTVLEACGPVIAIADETAFMQASAFGCYYGWVLALIREAAGWAIEQGVEAPMARQLAAQMTRAAATVASQRIDDSLDDLVGEVAKPGSFTGAGLLRLDQSGAIAAWRDALAGTHSTK